MDEVLEPYLTPEEVADRYRTTVATVRYWRVNKRGPKGVKVGTRVRYPMSEIRKYDEQLKTAAGIG